MPIFVPKNKIKVIVNNYGVFEGKPFWEAKKENNENSREDWKLEEKSVPVECTWPSDCSGQHIVIVVQLFSTRWRNACNACATVTPELLLLSICMGAGAKNPKSLYTIRNFRCSELWRPVVGRGPCLGFMWITVNLGDSLVGLKKDHPKFLGFM